MNITLTAGDGTTLTGTLPTGWHDTPLAGYAALATAADMPAQCQAVAQLAGLPAEPFLADVALLLPVRQACPWLFDGSLPEASGPVPRFTHAGTAYAHVGNLEKISAGQMEALLAFLREEPRPLLCAPKLLAVLYAPADKGKPAAQTAEVVAAAAESFTTLPMSVAWPALAAFFLTSAPRATAILTCWEMEEKARALLTVLEQAASLGGGVSRRRSWSIRRWLTKAWLRHARRALATS